MASDKDHASVRIFPPGVPVAVIVLGYFLNRVCPLEPAFSFPPPVRFLIGGLLASAAFFALGVWAVVLFRRDGQNENPWTLTPSLVQRGPFRLTRNPMYLEMIIVCVGFAVILMNWWMLILTPLGAWTLHRYAIIPEEAYLERKFGEQYLAYKRRVRRWL